MSPQRNENPCIQISELKFSYLNGPQLLHIPLLRVEKGEKIFIHGDSGAGKSTLLNLISGMTSFKKGSLEVFGTQLNSMSPKKRDAFRKKNIGYIFQSFNLIPYLTVYENILLSLKIKKLKDKGNIRVIAEQLEIDSLLDKNIKDLSIGQQQRVAVARALISDAPLIIADEPTSSLDDTATEKFMNLLKEQHQSKGFTLLFVSHEKRLESYFDKSLDLKDLNKVKTNV